MRAVHALKGRILYVLENLCSHNATQHNVIWNNATQQNAIWHNNLGIKTLSIEITEHDDLRHYDN
jgi:hypothetical protein